MKYIKNPLYIFAAITFLVVAGLYSINLYIRIQEHNLNVLTQIRLCLKDFDGENAKACGTSVKRLYIPKYIPVNNDD